jgi:nucleoid-associated protein YgaU
VPPARILERLYPTSVRGGGSAAPAPVSPTAIPTGSKNPAASLGPVAAKDLGGPNEYTVPHEGMTLKDVARDALGNESQWHRIFLLNRWVNPSAPLPTGAKLFLPRAGTQ